MILNALKNFQEIQVMDDNFVFNKKTREWEYINHDFDDIDLWFELIKGESDWISRLELMKEECYAYEEFVSDSDDHYSYNRIMRMAVREYEGRDYFGEKADDYEIGDL